MQGYTTQEIKFIKEIISNEIDEQNACISDLYQGGNKDPKESMLHINEVGQLEGALQALDFSVPLGEAQANVEDLAIDRLLHEIQFNPDNIVFIRIIGSAINTLFANRVLMP